MMDKELQTLTEDYLPLAVDFSINIVMAIAIFIIGKMIAKMIAGLIQRSMQRTQVDPTIMGFANNLIYALLMTLVIIVTLGQLGIQTASFVAIIGAAGLAVGLALQGSLANFASGVLILLFKPLKGGDYVEAGGTAGVVKEISIFCTILTSPDNKTIIVPNAAIMGGNIVNYSTQPTRRVDMTVGIAYDADLKLAKKELMNMLTQDERVLTDPPPTVAVSELADSSVNFVVRPWVNAADYWDVYFDTHEKVKLRFDELSIGIPFPQMDVHVNSLGLEKTG